MKIARECSVNNKHFWLNVSTSAGYLPYCAYCLILLKTAEQMEVVRILLSNDNPYKGEIEI